jgi:hypothetical protein
MAGAIPWLASKAVEALPTGNTGAFPLQTRELRGCPRIVGGRRDEGTRTNPMPGLSYRSSQPDRWIMPRPYSDASLRRHVHGPIQPMEEPGFLARLFRRH